MFTLDKYRYYDYITINGIDADVYQENEHGELINPIMCKDFSYFRAVSTIADDLTALYKNEWETAQNWFLTMLDENFYFEKTPIISDFCICGDTIQFWNRENANGESDTNGEYFVLYTLVVKINGIQVEENDLHYMFVGMEW